MMYEQVAHSLSASVFAALPTSPSSYDCGLMRTKEDIQARFRDISVQCAETSLKWDAAILYLT